ncbi:hypothetical protein AZA_40219 [Nitrospirillum viridazoti Y2]|nr:hypothetical protein AZA_40219 [Nitrospirillum amazonense Y2]
MPARDPKAAVSSAARNIFTYMELNSSRTGAASKNGAMLGTRDGHAVALPGPSSAVAP